MPTLSTLISDVYHVKDAFPIPEYLAVLDELNALYNPWIFNKVENVSSFSGVKEATKFGCLYKPDGNGVGDNLCLINAALIASYTVSKAIGKRVKLVRVNQNIQFAGQEATFHIDGQSNRWTYVLFTTMEWLPSWGGELLIQGGEAGFICVPYLPNTAAIFRADIYHRGSAPNTFCVKERKSVAFTYEEIL